MSDPVSKEVGNVAEEVVLQLHACVHTHTDMGGALLKIEYSQV